MFNYNLRLNQGKSEKEPHRPLVLCSFCLMTMVTWIKDSLNSRPNFEKKGSATEDVKASLITKIPSLHKWPHRPY